MRRNRLFSMLAVAAFAAGCGQASKTGSGGGSAYTGNGTSSYSIAVVKPTGGFITAASNAINCGYDGATDQAACDLNVATFTATTLTATPATDYSFTQWAGDCSGTATTCTLTPTSGKAWYRVVAVFTSTVPPPTSTPTVAKSRIYGYVKDGLGAAVSGVKVKLGADVYNADGTLKSAAPNSTSGATGVYAIDVDPGSYAVNYSDTVVDANGTPKNTYTSTLGVVAVPAVTDAACPAPSYITDPALGATGCMFRQDIVVTAAANGAYVAPPSGFTIAVTATPGVVSGIAGNKLAGFGMPVALSCTPTNASDSFSVTWTVTAGPVDVTSSMTGGSGTVASGAAQVATITTPKIAAIFNATALANGGAVAACPNGAGAGKPGSPSAGTAGGNSKLGCGVSNFASEGRPGFLPINQGQASEMTYTFTCTVKDTTLVPNVTLSKTVTVPLLVATNINLGNTLENLWNLYNGANGTVVPAGNFDQFGNAMGVFRATHYAPKAATNSIVIVDDYQGRTGTTGGYAWAWRKTSAAAMVPTAACLFDPVDCDAAASTPTINDANTANPWFFATGTAGLVVNTAALPANAVLSGTITPPLAFASATSPRPLALSFQGNYGGYTNNCVTCHDPKWGDPAKVLSTGDLQAKAGLELGPNKLVTEWQGSKHARIVTDGMSGTHYSANSCWKCHSLGWEPNLPATAPTVVNAYSVSKGGTFNWATAGQTFTAAALAWPDFSWFPSPAAQFAAFDTQIRARANVQCENCHGGAGAGGNNASACNGNGVDINGVACTGGGSTSHDASESAKVCGYCHDSGHHGIYSQWNSTGHANVATAMAEGPRARCGNCHSAQYFVERAKAIVATGASGLPPATIALVPVMPPAPATISFNGMALDANNAQPQTCQACHEPHSLELRIEFSDTVKSVILGTGATGNSNNDASLTTVKLDSLSGGGALCMACHNSRRANGSNQAGTAPYVPAAFNTPHDGPQAELYNGVGVYWFDKTTGALAATAPSTVGTNVHNSAFFSNSCADCHVKLVPAGFPTVANHTFDPNPACQTCHGGGVLPDGTNPKAKQVQDRTAGQVAAFDPAFQTLLTAAAGKYTLTVINDGGTTSVPTLQAATTVTTLTPAMITSVAFSTGVSNGGLQVWLNGNTGSIPDLVTKFESIKSSGTALVGPATAGIWLWEVSWNLYMVHNDGSGGIHNMSMVYELLNNSLWKVQNTAL